jgi:ubiquinone/menaquinone biosynthesis C-methylase UbiE
MAEMNSFSRFFVNLMSARNSRRRYQWLSPQLRVPPHPSCLEIGCGNGDFAARVLSGLGPERYVATDLDPRQIEVARHHLAQQYPQGLPNALELRIADMLELPFPNASFDVTFAFNVLHHSGAEHHDPANLPRALAELHRVLRPGGNLAYAEFLHKDRIRGWLSERGYAIAAARQHRRGELVVAIKPAQTEESVTAPA